MQNMEQVQKENQGTAENDCYSMFQDISAVHLDDF